MRRNYTNLSNLTNRDERIKQNDVIRKAMNDVELGYKNIVMSLTSEQKENIIIDMEAIQICFAAKKMLLRFIEISLENDGEIDFQENFLMVAIALTNVLNIDLHRVSQWVSKQDMLDIQKVMEFHP